MLLASAKSIIAYMHTVGVEMHASRPCGPLHGNDKIKLQKHSKTQAEARVAAKYPARAGESHDGEIAAATQSSRDEETTCP